MVFWLLYFGKLLEAGLLPSDIYCTADPRQRELDLTHFCMLIKYFPEWLYVYNEDGFRHSFFKLSSLLSRQSAHELKLIIKIK
jgi:hypothetical protein